MKQYAICVYQPDGPVPPPEVLGPIMEKVGDWRARLESAGAHPARSSHSTGLWRSPRCTARPPR